MSVESRGDEERPGPNWAGLKLVAKELQRWLKAIPQWAERSGESWEEFSRRHAKSEQELATRLRRLPGCTITRSTKGSATTLLLGGVEVRSHVGLAGACRDWIATVQAKADDHPPSG